MISDLSDILKLHDLVVRSKCGQEIRYSVGTLEIVLTCAVEDLRNELDLLGIKYDDSSKKSIEIDIDRAQIRFFRDTASFYDYICVQRLQIDGSNIFIWEYEDSCLLYENFQPERAKIDRTSLGDFILGVLQYRDCLEIFLQEKNMLIELDRVHPASEMFVSSKGEEKLLVKLGYNKIVEDLYKKRFEAIDLDHFSSRIQNEEWLACYKNTVCSFFDKQSDAKRTFLWLYENFAYLSANTEKSYLLYVSKFSFDKVSKQFKKEQEQYFQSLNEFQNKLSGQLISIPLTIGAAMLGDNFIDKNNTAKTSVVILIFGYVVFVIGTIIFVLADLIKLSQDVMKEEKHFEERYTQLYVNLKRDFRYIRFKSFSMIIFGFLLIAIFIYVLWVVLQASSVFK